jgi:nucleotide-binding universal stress UspA family protein
MLRTKKPSRLIHAYTPVLAGVGMAIAELTQGSSYMVARHQPFSGPDPIGHHRGPADRGLQRPVPAGGVTQPSATHEEEERTMTSAAMGPRLLVPLDGSARAERALPVAERIAQATHAPLILVRIVPLVPWPDPFGAPIPADTYQQLMDDALRLATESLGRTASALMQRGLAVETQIERGEPASALLDLLPTLRVGLVVMTTHGRTGLARFALGSVADRLVRYGHAPVLLVRAFPAEPAGATALDSALVPLDGSPLAEAALPLAVQFAGSLVHHLTLLRVVGAEASAQERAAAQAYVDGVRARLEQQLAGRSCTLRSLSVVGDPAEQIARWAEEDHSLVILASRGSSGIRRWVLGSVTDHLLQDTTVPLLVVHPQLVSP